MNAAILFLAGLLSFDAEATASGHPGSLEFDVDLAIDRSVGDKTLFDYAACVGGAALVHFRSNWAAGLMLSYQQILDSDPAVSFWYGNLGARGEALLPYRFTAQLDLGWAFRHIGVSGYSNTVGGPMAGAGVGWAALRVQHWLFKLNATYHITTRAPSEPFATQYVGIGVSAAWVQ